MTNFRQGLILFVAALAVSPGCASKSNKWKFASWDMRRAVGMKPKVPDPEIPARLVATWADATLTTAGEKPKRGFGGRISFFKRDSENAVRVDGQLVVYAFDETTPRPAHETQPTRRYVFPIAEVPRHESASAIGPAYSFWLPWDEIGGSQKNISLIARFEPKGGPIVIGEQTRHLLPGVSLNPDDVPQLAQRMPMIADTVKLAAYAGQAATPSPGPYDGQSSILKSQDKEKSLGTTTIALPKRLGDVMQQNQMQQQTTTLDVRQTRSLPLSQVATMQNPSSTVAVRDDGTVVEDRKPARSRAELPQAARGSAVVGAPVTKAMGASGLLRGSLPETLPAQATPAGREALGRAR